METETDDKTSLEEGLCSACHSTLSPGEIFCRNCGPPEPPPQELTGGMTAAQSAIGIIIILLVFSGIVVLKTGMFDMDTEKGLPTPGIENSETTPVEDPVGPDFHVVHYINVPAANVRKRGSELSSIVKTLKEGDQIKVLEKGDLWSHIEVDGTTGWIATRLLASRVE